MNNLGQRIKACRIACKLTQEEVANHLNIGKQAVYKYESGVVTNIPIDKIEKMATLFGVSPEYLSGWSDGEEAKKHNSLFRERFSELVSSSSKSQSIIASEFGVAKQTISAWITGQSVPRAPVLSALADYFNVNSAWLAGYDASKVDTNYSLTPDEEDLIRSYRSLSKEGKDYLHQQVGIAAAVFKH